MSRRFRAILAAGAAVLAFSGAVSSYSTYARWAAVPVTFYVNPANQDVSANAAAAAVEFALNVWSASGSSFRYQYGGTATDTATAFDNRNVLLFRNVSNGSTIATTYSWWNSSKQLLDSDVIMWDGGFRFFTGTAGCGTPSTGVYVEDIAAHEFGHALGLNHSSSSAATMYPTASYCSQNFRTLAADDIAGVSALYPPSEPPSSSPATLTAAGKIVNGLQRVYLNWAGLTGAQVDVYRNATKIKVAVNDGVALDLLKTSVPGSYSYRICATGTQICTNTAVVTF
jgi:hypothetical protein